MIDGTNVPSLLLDKNTRCEIYSNFKDEELILSLGINFREEITNAINDSSFTKESNFIEGKKETIKISEGILIIISEVHANVLLVVIEKDSNKIFEEVVMNIKEGVGLVNGGDVEVFKFANLALEEMFWVGKGELVGRNIREFVSDEDFETIRRHTSKRKEDGQKSTYDITIINPKNSDEKKIISITGAPQYNNSGEIIGTYGVFIDVTEERKTEMELKETKRKLEEMFEKMNVLFLGLVHDINNLLSKVESVCSFIKLKTLNIFDIIGDIPDELTTASDFDALLIYKHICNAEKNIKTLKTKGNIKDFDKYYKMFNSGVHDIKMLLGKILSLAQMESNGVKFEENIINIEEIIEDIFILSKNLDTKEISFNLKIDENSRRNFISDETYIKGIITNLIDNACKSIDSNSEDKRVTVNVKEISKLPNKSIIAITISDTGKGMDKSTLEDIFQIFRRHNQSYNENESGKGIGLTFLAKLIKEMKGDIRIESEEGKGTTFFIEIPLKPKERVCCI